MKIHIEITKETREKINEIRHREGLSLNWLVNRAITNYLKLKQRATNGKSKQE